MIKVLVVMDGTGTGGAETSMAAMAPLMAENGVEMEVAYFHDRSGAKEKFLEAGIPLHHLPHGRSRLATVWRLQQLIKQRCPDLVHTMVFEADVLGRTAARLSGTPSCSSIVTSAYNAEQYRLATSRWRLRACQLIDGVTAQSVRAFHANSASSARQGASALGIGAKPGRVIPRGRSAAATRTDYCERRCSARQAMGIPENQPVLLVVGRHEAAKGLLILPQFLSKLLERRGDAVLLLAGREGSETLALEKAISDWRVSQSFRLLGHRNDVEALLHAADILVFPSLWEGLPGTLIEALAVGCGVICSDIPPNREVLGEPGPGRQFFEPGNTDEMVWLAMEELNRSSGERESSREEGRARFLATFTIERSARGMADFYRDVLHREVKVRLSDL